MLWQYVKCLRHANKAPSTTTLTLLLLTIPTNFNIHFIGKNSNTTTVIVFGVPLRTEYEDKN